MTDIGPWIWPVALSPIAGSFVGVVVARAEAPSSIVFGRSRCDHCGTSLHPLDLIPFGSWFASGGKCRHCGQPISVFYPLVEVAAVAVAAWSATLTSGWMLLASCCFGWALLALTLTDFKYFLLLDFLTIPLIPAGLLMAWLYDPTEVPGHVLGAVLGFASVLTIRFLYRTLRGREGMGLGDAKLLAAAGAWVSWQGLASVVLLGAVTAMTYALLAAWRTGKFSLADPVPFGAFLCFGIWVVWLYGPLVIG